jgi:hypothetical protein
VPDSRFHFPSPPRWAFALVALLAFGFFLRVYAGIWTPEHGITKFLRVGQEFDDRGTEVFRATPKFIDPYPAHRWGFDGQLYAEMALDPLLLDPHLHIALDNPPYRAQRILLSWIAWGLGLGQPFWILNAYAALNLIFWVGFAWLSGRLFAPHGWAGLAGYAVTLVTCGVIESMQASLTDLPSFTLILAAIMIGGKAGACLLALAALVRSTSLIGFVGLAQLPPPWREAIRKNIVWGLIAVVPLACWVAYVLWRFQGREVNFDGGNLAMPFRGMMEKLGEFSVTAGHGSIRWHRWPFELYKSYELHSVLTMISVVTQIVFVAVNRNWRDPLWRWGAVVAAYFSCISFLSWESHFTITRHALPITLLFNVLLAARPGRSWLIWFLLGNCFVPFGVRYFDGMREFRSPPPLPEFAIEAPATIVAAPVQVQVRYGEGWSAQQWWPDTTWRWSRREQATVILRNAAPRPVRVQFTFLASSFHEREFRIDAASQTVLRTRLPAARRVITLDDLELPPGETTLTFIVSGEPSKTDDGTPGEVKLKMEKPTVRIRAP